MTSLTSHSAEQISPAATPSSDSAAAIQTFTLTKRFSNRPGSPTALDHIDLVIPRGSTYGLIGLNGAGKSTAIRLLVGLLAPTSGRALVNGVDVFTDPVRALASVGYVPDRPTAYAWMRIGEVLHFARSMWPTWNDTLAASLLTRYRLDPAKRISKLSKGAAAKLSLLLALAHDPDTLILDEPMDGLDPVAKEDFLEHVIGAVCDRPRTVLLSTHALADVQRAADHIGLLHNGRLIVQCPTEELITQTKRIRVVLDAAGSAEPATPARASLPQAPPGTVWSRLEGREWIVTVRGFTQDTLERIRAAASVRSLNVLDLNLDDVFKDVVRGQEALS